MFQIWTVSLVQVSTTEFSTPGKVRFVERNVPANYVGKRSLSFLLQEPSGSIRYAPSHLCLLCLWSSIPIFYLHWHNCWLCYCISMVISHRSIKCWCSSLLIETSLFFHSLFLYIINRVGLNLWWHATMDEIKSVPQMKWQKLFCEDQVTSGFVILHDWTNHAK